ncbi:MAG: Ig-like domain-containing protein [Armatimonadetes bacterium]|nr:Ig-like domain-containing protein [Armatimonadota bacterium]
MMKRFLESPLARRIAWMTLTALAVGLIGPAAQRADAQEAVRGAYFVPFTAAEGVDAETPVRIGNGTAELLQRMSGDPRAKQPLAVLPVVPALDGHASLSPSNPIVKRALSESAITQEEVDSPPTAAEPAAALCRKLGLGYVITGNIDRYKEGPGADGKSQVAELSYTVKLTEVLPEGAVAQPRTVPISGVSKYTATTDKDKIILRAILTDRVSREIVSQLIELPELAPEPQTEVQVKPKPAKGSNAWAYAGVVVAGIASIFLISTIGGGKTKAPANLAVTGVAAVSEQDAVRITWLQAPAAIGYNVYRRQVGSQPLVSRALRGRTTADGFTVLPNPQTNSVPTVVGGNRTSFIDTTAVSGVVYEYAVAGMNASNVLGARSSSTTAARTGANIGAAPQLTASAGNGFVSLNWSASSAFVTGYFVYRRQGGVPDTVTAADRVATVTGRTTFDDTPLTNGVEYTYVVQPYTQIGTGQKLIGTDSNRVTIAPMAGAPPQAPRGVAAVASNLGVVTVSWQFNAEPVASYEVLRLREATTRQRTVTGSSSWLRGLPVDLAARAQTVRVDPRRSRQIDLTGYSVVGSVPSTQNSFVEGPLPDGLYTYAVRAVSSTGVRGPVGVSTALTVSSPPAAPAGVTATGQSGAVLVAWQSAAGNVSAYRVYRSLTAITASMTGPATAPGISRVTEVNPSVTSFSDTGVTNNTVYYYAVTAVGQGGTESLFGKGTATTTGAVGVPHAAPATMTLATDRPLISANGMHTAAITATVQDLSSIAVPGVEVIVTADRGSFKAPLPANASYVDATKRQVRSLTDATGKVVLNFMSEVITTAATQVVANIQARAAELPVAQQLQSTSVAMQSSAPSVLLMSPALVSLTADQASTQTVAARVLDSLNQPVPDGTFSVDFSLSADNGELRQSGDVQTYPFQRYPTTITVPVTTGRATMVYRAGPASGTLQINAAVAGLPAVASSATVRLSAGEATQVSFSQTGTTLNQLNVPVSGSQAITVDVRDAQGNRVGAGVAVQLAVEPTGVVTIPASGVTDANGQVALNITGGAVVGDAIITATAGTSAEGQLAVHVR